MSYVLQFQTPARARSLARGQKELPMLVGFGRLFLFLLLVCDWVGDPYHGQSPLSRPGSSQDVYCYSMSCRNVVRLAVAPPGIDNQAAAASPHEFLAPPPSASSP